MAGEKSPPRSETAYTVGRSDLLIPEFQLLHTDNPSWDILTFFRDLWTMNENDATLPTIQSSQQISRSIQLPATASGPETLLTATIATTPTIPAVEAVLPVVARTLGRRVDDRSTHAGLRVSWRTGQEIYGIDVADEQGAYKPYFRIIKGRYSRSFSHDEGDGVPPGVEIEGRRIERIPAQRTPDDPAGTRPDYADTLLEAMEHVQQLLS